MDTQTFLIVCHSQEGSWILPLSEYVIWDAAFLLTVGWMQLFCLPLEASCLLGGAEMTIILSDNNSRMLTAP